MCNDIDLNVRLEVSKKKKRCKVYCCLNCYLF